MNGVRAGVSVWPDVSVGQVSVGMFHLSVDHLHCQSGGAEDVVCPVRLCEPTEGRGV